MATNFTSWYDDVLPWVPGCPQSMALNVIRKAAIEFCDRSWAWIYYPAGINVVNGQMAYAFTPPANAVVTRTLQVWYDDEPIDPATPDELNALFQNWRTHTGTPQYHTQDDERNLLLVPTPDADLTGGLKMRVALKPTITAVDIETRIYEEHREAIASGAKARLMLMQKKPYSDPNQAVIEQDKFDSAINTTKIKIIKGFSRAPLRNVAQFF